MIRSFPIALSSAYKLVLQQVTNLLAGSLLTCRDGINGDFPIYEQVPRLPPY